MVEVFKTDVTNPEQAKELIARIRSSFIDYEANFDLQDCDHILRVTSKSASIDPLQVIELMVVAGHRAEVLADEYVNINETLVRS